MASCQARRNTERESWLSEYPREPLFSLLFSLFCISLCLLFERNLPVSPIMMYLKRYAYDIFVWKSFQRLNTRNTSHTHSENQVTQFLATLLYLFAAAWTEWRHGIVRLTSDYFSVLSAFKILRHTRWAAFFFDVALLSDSLLSTYVYFNFRILFFLFFLLVASILNLSINKNVRMIIYFMDQTKHAKLTKCWPHSRSGMNNY